MFNKSPYNIIKNWIIREYKEPGIFLETIQERYKAILADQRRAVNYENADHFVLATIDALKRDKILKALEDTDNMWIIAR